MYRMASWTLNEAALPPEVLVIETVMSAPLRLEIQGIGTHDLTTDVLIGSKSTGGVVLLAVFIRHKSNE